MGTITTAKTDVSLDNLATYIETLSDLETKNQSEISSKITEIDGLLDTNIGSTSTDLKDLNTYISDLQTKLVELISETKTSMTNITTIFADEDAEDAEIISSSDSSGD